MNYKQCKQCEVCGKEYVTKSANSKYCSDCKKKAYNKRSYERRQEVKKERTKKKRIKVDTLELKEKEIAEYNKLHGTHYTYGEYYAMKKLGKIK